MDTLSEYGNSQSNKEEKKTKAKVKSEKTYQ